MNAVEPAPQRSAGRWRGEVIRRKPTKKVMEASAEIPQGDAHHQSSPIVKSKTENPDLGGCEFIHTDLGAARFRDVRPAEARFTEVNPSEAVFENVDLSRAVIRNANRSHLTIEDACCEGMCVDGIPVGGLLRVCRHHHPASE